MGSFVSSLRNVLGFNQDVEVENVSTYAYR